VSINPAPKGRLSMAWEAASGDQRSPEGAILNSPGWSAAEPRVVAVPRDQAPKGRQDELDGWFGVAMKCQEMAFQTCVAGPHYCAMQPRSRSANEWHPRAVGVRWTGRIRRMSSMGWVLRRPLRGLKAETEGAFRSQRLTPLAGQCRRFAAGSARSLVRRADGRYGQAGRSQQWWAPRASVAYAIPRSATSWLGSPPYSCGRAARSRSSRLHLDDQSA
jgi:hypothetical protein